MEVEDREVGGGVGNLFAEQGGGAGRPARRPVGGGHALFDDEDLPGDGGGGFGAHDAVRARAEAARLARGGMGCVVGRENAEGTVLDGGAERGDVFAGTEGRGHLPVRVIAGDVVAGEEQVVRGRLAGDGKPLALGVADERDRPRAGDVLDVEGAARHAAEGDVAPHGLDLGGGWQGGKVETAGDGRVAQDAARRALRREGVLHDGAVELCGAAHGRLHHMGVLDERTVVRERDGPGGGQRLQVGDLPAEPSLRDAGRGGDAHGKGGILDLLAQPGGRVAGGGRVRHRGDAGEAARRRRRRARRARLGLRLARVAEMDVDVAQAAWHDEVAAWIVELPEHFFKHGDMIPYFRSLR